MKVVPVRERTVERLYLNVDIDRERAVLCRVGRGTRRARVNRLRACGVRGWLRGGRVRTSLPCRPLGQTRRLEDLGRQCCPP